MKRALPLVGLALFLTSCVDTAGIPPMSSKTPKGNPQSVVTVIEYADIECPACRAAHATIIKPLLEKYGAQVRFDFRHFPLRSIHRYTMDLAEAAECAADQGKFWEYVEAAFEKQQDLKKGSAQLWGEELVSDNDMFSRCVRSHVKQDAIIAEYDAGIAAGVKGTPTFMVNGEQIAASAEDISAAIDVLLKGATQRL